MRESRLWLIFLLSGLIIFFLLGIHLFYMHLEAILSFFGFKTGPVLDYAGVIERAKNPNWVLLYLALLTFSLYHGLYGLRSLLLELNIKEKAVNSTLLAIGILALTFGAYVIIKSYSLT